MICNANQLTGFYLMGTLAAKRLRSMHLLALNNALHHLQWNRMFLFAWLKKMGIF